MEHGNPANAPCWCAHMDPGMSEFIDVDLGGEKFVKSISVGGGTGEHE